MPYSHRRPWSPDPYDPHTTVYHDHHRELSDASIEALDLADYAQSLRRTADRDFAQHRYPLPFNPPPPPPSLTSGGRTSSSRSHAHSAPIRRPYSVPPRTSTPPRLEAFPPVPQPDEEIDVAQFPPWSRNWYTRPKIFSTAYHVPDEELDIVSSSPNTHTSPWDPTFNHPDSTHHHHPLPYFPDHPSSNHRSDIILPWSADPADSGPPLDAEVKEERIRMLEREFGAKHGQNAASSNLNRPPVGTVDEKGKLVTEGPKKRSFTRFIQVFLALGAAVPSIYVALIIKPTSGVPPPASRAPAYALYILSVFTSVLLLFLFLVHPCCIARGRSSDSDGSGGGLLPGGLAVLPVGTAGSGAGSQPKKGGGNKGKNRGAHPGGGDVQVNLIVDPALFDQREYEEPEGDEYEYDSDAYTLPSSSSRRGAYQRRRPPPRSARRSIFVALAQENQWREARAWLKKLMVVDVCGIALWGALFVFILLGKRCPSGQYQGWCTGYNVATAAACLLCVAFGVSTFFDIKDLYASRVSPRSR